MEKELEKIKSLFKDLKKLSQKIKISHNEFIEKYKLENQGVKFEIEELQNLVKSTKK